jgi:F0F1-type ATP synthase assembly protein I
LLLCCEEFFLVRISDECIYIGRARGRGRVRNEEGRQSSVKGKRMSRQLLDGFVFGAVLGAVIGGVLGAVCVVLLIMLM